MQKIKFLDWLIIQKTIFILLIFGVLFSGQFIQEVFASCGADQKECNGKCISTTDICLMMPFGEDASIEVDSKTDSFSIVSQYVSMVYKWGVVVTGLLAVLMIVVGGIQYIVYGADPGQKDDAKGRIQQALVALTLLLLSALLLRTINPNFFHF